MRFRIINLKLFFNQKHCVRYILFFTFAKMKTNNKQRHFSSYRNRLNSSLLRILNRFYYSKSPFCFDVFLCSKAENEKLEIVFANIRV